MARYIAVFVTFLLIVCPSDAQQSSKSKDIYVEIPYELESGVPIIEVLIKGKPYKFVLDTGAPKTFIARHIVDELSLKLRKSTKAMGDAHGIRKQQQQVVIEDMQIGGIPFITSKALVSESDSYLFTCYNFDGIIGGDFLKRFAVKFDSRAKTITLTTNVSRLVSGQQQWGKMRLFYSKPHILIPLEGHGNDSFLFDSGSGMSSIEIDTTRYRIYSQRNFLDFSDEETGFGSASIGLHGVRVNEKKYRATAAEFSFGGYIFHNAPIQTSRTPKVGYIITNYGDVILDYPNKRYCFIPHHSEVSWTSTKNKVGCAVNNSKLIISVVWGEELCKQITVGDRIVMIGNQRFDNVERCYRASLSLLIKEHTTPDNNVILLEKPNGEQYTLSADVFLP